MLFSVTGFAGTEITAERAKEIALAQTGGGIVTGYRLDYEHGGKVYEIDIVNGDTQYEIDVGAADSQIYKFEQRTIPANGVPASGDSSGITAEKAKEIALSKVGGGVVIKCKLDYEHGGQVYEIEIRRDGLEYEMDIDVATGNIVKYEIDD
jgi:uncharacterized membrane protein YkoI